MKNIISHIESKFTSGNNIPVKQAVIKVEEWRALRDLIASLKKENERLRWQLKDQD